ncbi:MAG: ABC transporter permease [Phascolarctobacterium sp.]|uniref:ABC transporter permease n=1 Tax=Phascolarctobacterium sp. TaxID=2049039 RepID=UPI0026DB9BC6|nr:ABC transporter permease [Phascolarctobacterium sp.]MDO4922249.1 ABC transporter permease [Phascolarctobacterium sp.]
MIKNLKQLWGYNWLLQELIVRDLKIKYRRSVLGYLWSVLNPLLMMTIMTIVFSNMFRFDIPNYPVYLLAGQLIYTFFSESTSMAMYSILGGAALIKKVYLPKYIFPLSRVLSCFTTMLFSMLALFIVMMATATSFHITLVLLPVVLIYLLLFCIGFGLLLSVLMVFFQDMQHLYGVFLTAFNYLTPIFYPANLLPPWLQNLLVLNPLYDIITIFRKVVIYGEWPTLTEHLLCICFSMGVLILGVRVFKKNQNKFILYV